MATKPSNEALQIEKPVPKLLESQKKEIIKRVFALSEVTGEILTPKRIDLYLQCLADLDAEKVTAALDGALLSCKWFPKIPEIREMVLGPAVDRKLLGDAEGEVAWENVLNFVDRWHPDIGPYQDAPSLSELERRALNVIGGPGQVQDQVGGGKGLPFLHRDFIAAFARLNLIKKVDVLMLGKPELRLILGKIRLTLPAADEKAEATGMQSIAEIAQNQ